MVSVIAAKAQEAHGTVMAASKAHADDGHSHDTDDGHAHESANAASATGTGSNAEHNNDDGHHANDQQHQ